MYQNKQDSSAEIQVRNDAFISLRKMGKEKKAIKDGRLLSEWLLLFTAVQRNQGTQSICFILLFLLPCRLVLSTQRGGGCEFVEGK